MNEFSKGFNIGFSQGMFNNMLGGSFSNPFLGSGCGCCGMSNFNSMSLWNYTPMVGLGNMLFNSYANVGIPPMTNTGGSIFSDMINNFKFDNQNSNNTFCTFVQNNPITNFVTNLSNTFNFNQNSVSNAPTFTMPSFTPTFTPNFTFKSTPLSYSNNTFTKPTGYSNNLSSASNTQYDSLIKKYSQQYGVDANLVKAVMATESTFNPNAVSSAGCVGLMQLSKAAAQDMGVNRNNVEDNIKGGVKYLKTLIDKYGNIEQALAAYNGGSGNVPKNGGVPAKYKKYVNTVMGHYNTYKKSA